MSGRAVGGQGVSPEWVWWLLAGLLATTIGVAFGLGVSTEPVIIALLFLPPVILIGKSLSDEVDRPWLPLLLPAAYAAKMLGSGARYLVLQLLYGGVGDSIGYHSAGHQYAEIFRSLQFPDLSGFRGGFGTMAARVTSGVIYSIYSPTTLMGGFIMFSLLCFMGQLFLYLALRRSIAAKRRIWFALGCFFVPTMIFWPSSIGKDALMVFGIGMAAWGLSKLFDRVLPGPLVVALLGLGLMAVIRAHVAALVTVSFVVALVISRRPGSRSSPGRTFVTLIVALSLMGAAGWVMSRNLNLDISEEGLTEFAERQEGKTDTGGSAVEGDAVSGPQDIPEAFLRVLFRPLLHEASGAELASAIEGTALFAIFLWRLPTLIRNTFGLRRRPMLLFCAVYTFGFAVMFSPVLNLGILVRQRSMVMVFLLAWIIGAGWGKLSAEDAESEKPAASELPSPQLTPA